MSRFKEYGGYLPLELPQGRKEYYQHNLLRLNSGRYAILTAVKQGHYNKVYLPYYICETVIHTLDKAGVNYEFYHINRDFYPELNSIGQDEVLLWVNYFGVFGPAKAKKIVEKYKNVILDNTEAFFAEPIQEVYNVYSCKKFIGVSDGAYLIGTRVQNETFAKDNSFCRAIFLLKAYEEGTNAAYGEQLANEDIISESGVRQMSLLTKRILESADYGFIQERRRSNYQLMDEELGRLNELKLPWAGTVPMFYPFVISDASVRGKLLAQKIYISRLFKWLLETDYPNEFERWLLEYLLPLPIDQRYDSGDIREMIAMIKSSL